MATLEFYKENYLERWVTLRPNRIAFLNELYNSGIIDYGEYANIILTMPMPLSEDEQATVILGPAELVPGGPPEPTEAERARLWEETMWEPSKQVRAEITETLWEKQRGTFANAFHEVLVSLWRWIIDKMKEVIDLIVNAVKPVLESAWEFAKAKLEEAGRGVYDYSMKMFEGHVPMTPEAAPGMASRLYLYAMGAGTAAHGVATVTELLHPLRQIGLHQTAAMIGEYSGFGRITGATIGPLMSRVLGQAMTYNVQQRFRPKIPDAYQLIEFRSKREIDKSEFDEAMGYHGFSRKWIDIIERWQWKDPRMFEIIRLADIGLQQGDPPSSEMPWLRRFGVTGDRLKDWWLWRKFMRAGYEDVDIPVMVRFIHRREVSFALTYVRTAVRRNYRWGFMDDEDLDKWLDRLQLPEQAKQWISDAGELDRDYFYKQDLVTYYKTAYRNDVINDDQFLISLLSIGLPARESDIIVRTERIKKKPSPVSPVAKAAEKATAELQKKYITLYITQFRKDLINDSRLLESLMAIGLERDLAEVTVSLEAAKKGVLLPA